MPADDYLDATTAAFVGIFVARLFGFAALLAYVAFLLLALAAAALLAR